MPADDRLVENEYFARIAEDYRAHTNWIEEGEKRMRGVEGQNGSSSALPSTWWLRVPAREGQGSVGFIPQHEKGRWGERMRAVLGLWTPLQESDENRDANYRALRRLLDPLLESHFSGHGYGAPRTGRALIEEMKADDAVNQLGDIAGETLRRAFDRFLEGHPDLVATPIRVQFEGPYMATEVIEMGGEVFENATRLRDAFRSFIKAECGPYF